MVLLKNKLSLLSAALLFTITSVRATPDPNLPVSSLLANADTLLAAGDNNAALEYFDVAIKKDSSNYMILFKRGVAYLALGRSAKASEDFDAVLVLKPGFEAALLQRAKLKAKSGDWDFAISDYTQAGADKHSERINEIHEASSASKEAHIAHEQQNWDKCIKMANDAIMVASKDPNLRGIRIQCRMENGDVHEVLGDLQHIAQLKPSSIEPHVKMAVLLYYSLKDFDRATAQLRKCLHSDPDSKQCSKLFRQIKNYEKSINNARELRSKRQFNSSNKILLGTSDEEGVIPEVTEDMEKLITEGYINKKCPQGLKADLLEMVCDNFIEMNRSEKAQPYCVEALQHNPQSIPAILFKASRHLSDERFEEAIKVLETAKEEIDGAANDRRIAAKLKEAHQLLQRSKIKDYYGVLGLKRGASAHEIKKAYRKLIKQFHPDKYRGHLSKEEIQKKMSAINEANEVLGNPEMKELVDKGIDPLAQETQQNPFHGQNPFGGFGGPQFVFRQDAGGNPFGNGGPFAGGGFKFHF